MNPICASCGEETHTLNFCPYVFNDKYMWEIDSATNRKVKKPWNEDLLKIYHERDDPTIYSQRNAPEVKEALRSSMRLISQSSSATIQKVNTTPTPKLKRPNDKDIDEPMPPPQKQQRLNESNHGQLQRRGIKRPAADPLPVESTTVSKEPESYCKPQMFTIVTGLRSFIRDGNTDGQIRVDIEELMRVINDDVFLISMAMSELSLYLHFVFAKMHHNHGFKSRESIEYYEDMNTTSLRKLLRETLGQKPDTEPRDVEYEKIRNSMPLHQRLPMKYDTLLRSALLYDALDRYETCLKNAIILRMHKLLVRYFEKVPDDYGDKMSRVDARAYVKSLLSGDFDADYRLEISFDELKDHPYRYIPFLYALQEELTDEKNVKSFKVIPMNSYQQRFVYYCPSAIHELTRRYCKMTNQQAPQGRIRGIDKTRAYHNLFFKIDKFEDENKSYRGLLTDGVRAHVIMNRVIKEVPRVLVDQSNYRIQHNVEYDKSLDLPFPNYDYVAGGDPGKKLMYGATILNVSTGARSLVKYKSRQYLTNNGYYDRKWKHNEWSKQVESRVAKAREALLNIGPTAWDFKAFVKLELTYFMRKINLYAEPKFRHLKFDNYIRRRQELDRFSNEFCPKDGTTLLFHGSAKCGPCIKGYVSTPQRGLEAAFRRLDRCTVLYTSEFRSTKCCCRCFNVLRVPRDQANRSRYCETCKREFNRDTNAGHNMITIGLAQHYPDLGYVLPQGLRRQPRNPVDAEDLDESEDSEDWDGSEDSEDMYVSEDSEEDDGGALMDDDDVDVDILGAVEVILLD